MGRLAFAVILAVSVMAVSASAAKAGFIPCSAGFVCNDLHNEANYCAGICAAKGFFNIRMNGYLVGSYPASSCNGKGESWCASIDWPCNCNPTPTPRPITISPPQLMIASTTPMPLAACRPGLIG